MTEQYNAPKQCEHLNELFSPHTEQYWGGGGGAIGGDVEEEDDDDIC